MWKNVLLIIIQSNCIAKTKAKQAVDGMTKPVKKLKEIFIISSYWSKSNESQNQQKKENHLRIRFRTLSYFNHSKPQYKNFQEKKVREINSFSFKLFDWKVQSSGRVQIASRIPLLYLITTFTDRLSAVEWKKSGSVQASFHSSIQPSNHSSGMGWKHI